MTYGSASLPLTGTGDANAAPAIDRISSVDYQRVKLTTGAEGSTVALDKAEDSAHSSGDPGIMLLAVRQDTAAALAGTDGDYIPLIVDSTGRLWVDIGVLTPGTAAANLGKAEDAAHASGDTGVAVWGVRNDNGSTTFAGTNGDYSPIAVDSSGRVLLSNASPILSVSVDDQDAAFITAGDVAHDAADSGYPVKIGGQARTTNPTAVADADRVNAIFDDLGRQVVALGQVRDLIVQQATTISNTAETTILTAAAATFHDLVSLDITNASDVDTVVSIRDDTAGTVIANYALAACGGLVKTWSRPFKQTAVNKAWTAQLSVAATVYFVVQAEKNI